MRASYIIINRAEDFRRGLLVNLKPEGQGLTFKNAEGISKASLYLSSMDAEQNGFVWNRVVVSLSDFEGFVRISAYASDSPFFEQENTTLNEYLLDPYISQSVKTGVLDPLFSTAYVGGKDVLLGVKGRYLWLKIEFVLTGGKPPLLSKVECFLRDDHMLDYLPAVYRRQDDGFLYRYLSIFDSMVKDMERHIDSLDQRIDLDKASGEMLRFLAGWVSVDEEEASDERLRLLMARAVREYEQALTPRGVKRLIQRWTGYEPTLVEHFQIAPMLKRGADRELYKQLFGDKTNCFYVLLPEKAFPSDEEAQAFMQRLSRNIPAHVEAELVPLRDSIYLDAHSYLGVNSVIASHTGAAIDQRVSIQYDTVIGGDPA